MTPAILPSMDWMVLVKFSMIRLFFSTSAFRCERDSIEESKAHSYESTHVRYSEL